MQFFCGCTLHCINASRTQENKISNCDSMQGGITDVADLGQIKVEQAVSQNWSRKCIYHGSGFAGRQTLVLVAPQESFHLNRSWYQWIQEAVHLQMCTLSWHRLMSCTLGIPQPVQVLCACRTNRSDKLLYPHPALHNVTTSNLNQQKTWVTQYWGTPSH